VTPEFAEAGEALAASPGPAVNDNIGRARQEMMLGPGLGLEARDDLHPKSSFIARAFRFSAPLNGFFFSFSCGGIGTLKP
jgi:hypothetical protein